MIIEVHKDKDLNFKMETEIFDVVLGRMPGKNQLTLLSTCSSVIPMLLTEIV
jgi:hypothetical protein